MLFELESLNPIVLSYDVMCRHRHYTRHHTDSQHV